ncbi:MAG: ABC transporter permease [Clostridia bacterium]|nr:ABC transporter permease [Clostridia bacterium]
MRAIYRRELKSYFNGIAAYIFIAFILLFVGIYTWSYNLNGKLPFFEYVLANVGFVFMLIVPILTMRVISEEKKQRTDKLLYSLPLSTTQIVMGKYLAMLTVFAIPIGVMCFYPLILSRFGYIEFVTTYGSIFAFFLQGAALIAIGMFLSSLTENQIVAAVLTFAVVLVSYFMYSLASLISASATMSLIAFSVLIAAIGGGAWLATKKPMFGLCIFGLLEIPLLAIFVIKPALLEGSFQTLIKNISVFNRLYSFIDGVFDLVGIVFFLSVIFLFVFLTVQSLEKRRWS